MRTNQRPGTLRGFLAAIALCFPSLAALAVEPGFLEEFALSRDRTEVLKQLIPGTEDFYFFHSLHNQNLAQLGDTAKLDEVEKLLVPWVQKHGRTQRVVEIENRQILLGYQKNPRKALDALRDRLTLDFGHQRESEAREARLPARLDNKLLGREMMVQRALDHSSGTTDGFEDRSLEWAARLNLGAERRRHLLGRLTQPDVPGLVQLVVDDLNAPHSSGFGSLAIHRRLLVGQLDECLGLKPELLNETNFVNEYLVRLTPSADEDWRRDAKVREAFLDRLWSFATRLSPAHNSLKAHILYHRLHHDRALGVFDAERFLIYVRLPRNASYMSPQYLRKEQGRSSPVDLNARFDAVTFLSPVGNDEPLVRSYLERVFLETKNVSAYAPYFESRWFKRLQAETGILYGIGSRDAWHAILSPSEAQALKERIDIDFAPTNKTYFDPEEPVALDVFIKNTGTLLVKVFEVNAANYYREKLGEVEATLDLDGLVAGEERTLVLDDPPLRRVKRRLEFPLLAKRGAFVVELIGNGKASRAVIRKGQLQHTVRTSIAGHVFTVMDEAGRKVLDARLWLAGKEYLPDGDGSITVPFSSKPGRQIIVLERGNFASLATFQHEAESYNLRAGIHVEREALIAGSRATVIIRPSITLNGVPVSLSLLEDPKLLLKSTDVDGVDTTQEIKVELADGAEIVHEFQVPARLASIGFVLAARVENVSQRTHVALGDSRQFAVNRIDKTDRVHAAHLMFVRGEYSIEVLGRTGERRSGRVVAMKLKHLDFREPLEVRLETDRDGRIELGSLKDVDWIALGEDLERLWRLPQERASQPGIIHGKQGGSILVAHMGKAGSLARSDVSLLEVRGERPVRDRFDAISAEPGYLRIEGLAPGDYELLLKGSGDRIAIQVAAGSEGENHVTSPTRRLELFPRQPLAIASAAIEGDALRVRIGGPVEVARVHVLATRYVPDDSAHSNLEAAERRQPRSEALRAIESVYVTGRDIGDEYRYILERKQLKKRPGNMLDRPSLLLNPWAVRDTQTTTQEAGAGAGWDAPVISADREMSRQRRTSLAAEGRAPPEELEGYANLDFLAESAVVLTNLRPGADGVVSIPRIQLGAHSEVQIVAVTPEETVSRILSLPEPETRFRDLRLLDGLNPQLHQAMKREVSFVEKGLSLTIPDASTAQIETYDSIAKVHRLLVTLSGDSTLSEFGFIGEWPKLSAEEKRAKYSKYASHELSFFLYKKDPEFFREVIRPYLESKLHKTFLDHWLLGAELKQYLEPAEFGQLNVVERILLAQRIEGEGPRVARHARDLLDLVPVDLERRDRLFKTALRGRAFEERSELKAPSVALLEEKLDDALAKNLADKSELAVEMDLRAEEAPEESAGGKRQQAKKLAARPARKGQGEASSPPAEMAADSKDAASRDYFERGDTERRRKVRQLFKTLEKTQEWAENQYYHLSMERQGESLVTVSPFWADYARHDAAKPFFSPYLAEASRNFTEAMFALSVLDIAFEPATPELVRDGKKLTVVGRGPLVVFHEQVKAAEIAPQQGPILVAQNVYRQDDRYVLVEGEKLDKFVTGELLTHVVYGCQVVITNPTSGPQKLDVLLQIPRGAFPVLGSTVTRSVQVQVQPFQTWTSDYHFYFSKPGTFVHFPVHAARNEKLVGFAEPRSFQVVNTQSEVDLASWQHVSQEGTEDQVLEFLRTRNLQAVPLERAAWRLRDKAFFERVHTILRERHVFNSVVWSYGVLHDVLPAARELLRHSNDFVARCGAALVTTLLTIDPVERRVYEHLEYSPLVNARTHRLGKERTILNDRFREQYAKLLTILSYHPTLDASDLLGVTYYLLLQDRVDEARSFFALLRPDRLASRLQYDYLSAYLGFSTGDLVTSRSIAEKHGKHPVERWRKLFQEVLRQVEEIESKPAAEPEKSRQPAQGDLAATEPVLDLEIQGGEVIVHHRNLAECRLSYYLMDVELLFSRNPFVGEQAGQFAYVQPNVVETVKFDDAQRPRVIAIAERFLASNVLVEVTGAGIRRTRTRYSGALSVEVSEGYAQARAISTDTRKPFPGVYVKVYAKMQDGNIKFYKDGYTDLRGRFDYGSLSTNDLDNVSRFAMLFLSEARGAVVREAGPPKR